MLFRAWGAQSVFVLCREAAFLIVRAGKIAFLSRIIGPGAVSARKMRSISTTTVSQVEEGFGVTTYEKSCVVTERHDRPSNTYIGSQGSPDVIPGRKIGPGAILTVSPQAREALNVGDWSKI